LRICLRYVEVFIEAAAVSAKITKNCLPACLTPL